MATKQAIVSPYERLAWRLLNGGGASRNDLKFAEALGLSVRPEASFREAEAIFERCTTHLVADSALWVVPLIPGVPLIGHPERAHLDLVSDKIEDVCATEAGIFLLTRDGRRPGQFRVNPIRHEPNKEFLRSAVLCSSRQRHRPGGNHAIPGVVRRAVEALVRGDSAAISDVALSSPPQDPFDELSDSLFGAAWDIADAVCAREVPAVAAGMYDRPHLHSRLLRSRLAVLQQVALVFIAPLTLNPLRLQLAVLEWTRVDNADISGDAINAATAVVNAHALWASQFADLLADLLITEGFLASNQSTTFRRAIAAQQVLLSGWRALTQRVSALGFGTAALRLERCGDDHQDRVMLARRLWGARILGQLSLPKAAAIVGISADRGRRLLKQRSIEPSFEAILPALAECVGRSPTTLEGWRERWRQGEIPIASFDRIDALFPLQVATAEPSS